MSNESPESANPRDWTSALLPQDAALKDAISNLNESGLQIALVVTADRTLIGTLTDGDIRRGLLRGLSLDSAIAPLVKQHPLVVPPDLGRQAVLQLMRANRVHQLPVIDEQRRVVGLHLLDDLITPTELSNLMVIMAGGRGTRLRPHTENCPKPLLPVGSKPILEHIIERAHGEGFNHFALAVHYLGHMIEEYFGDGRRLGVHIDYVREQSPLGTAGAIGLLMPQPQKPFVVTNGDVLTEIRYAELLDFHNRHNAAATMAVRLHEWQHPFGVVRTQGIDIIGFDEKPVSRSHINAGIYVIDPSALALLTENEHCDMPTLFARVKDSGGRTIAYPMHEPWLDVGRDTDLQRARAAHSPGG